MPIYRNRVAVNDAQARRLYWLCQCRAKETKQTCCRQKAFDPASNHRVVISLLCTRAKPQKNVINP